MKLLFRLKMEAEKKNDIMHILRYHLNFSMSRKFNNL